MAPESAIIGQQRAVALRSFLNLLLLAAAINGATNCQARRTPLPPSPPPPSPPLYVKKGLRLVRFSQMPVGRKDKDVAVFGRLEVKIAKTSMRTGYTENRGWAPVCDDGSFGVWHAEEFCNIMGFKYGVKYNGSGISSFGQDEAYRPNPLGQIQCFDEPWRGRPASWLGWIDFPSRMNKFCYLFWSGCPSQKLVALQCSDSRLSPPLPPRPPAPLVMDRALGVAIRHFEPEPNLEVISYYGIPYRVELLVNSSEDGHSGSQVWAPLCASPEQMSALTQQPRYGYGDASDILANTSCYQSNYFTDSWFLSLTGYALSPARIPDAVIPGYKDSTGDDSNDGSSTGDNSTDGSSNDGSSTGDNSNDGSSNDGSKSYYGSGDWPALFDPSTYTHWVTIVGGIQKDRFSLQEMKLNVSTAPCETGYLFIVRCDRIVF